MHVIGLTGFKQAGKSSTAAFLKARGFVEVAFADPVRQLAEAIDPIVTFKSVFTDGDGWNDKPMRYTELLKTKGYEGAKKHDEVRRLLQRIGTEAGRQVLGADIWVKLAGRKLAECFEQNLSVVVSDVRFPNEAQAIHDFGGMLWRITRTGVAQPTDLHESEAHIPTLPADLDIAAANLTELEDAVTAALDALIVKGMQ